MRQCSLKTELQDKANECLVQAAPLCQHCCTKPCVRDEPVLAVDRRDHALCKECAPNIRRSERCGRADAHNLLESETIVIDQAIDAVINGKT